jgi:hypothetical protein
MRSPGWLYPLRVLAAFLAVLLTVLLLSQFGDRTRSLDLGTPQPVTDATYRPLDPPCRLGGWPVLTLLLRHADVAEGTILAEPTLCFPTARLRLIEAWDLRHPWRGLSPVIRYGDLVSARFAREPLMLTVEQLLPTGEQAQRIPLGRFNASPDPAMKVLTLRPLTLPLLGNEEDYPFDQYSLSARIDLALPQALILKAPGRPPLSSVPLRIELVAANDLRGYRVTAGTRGRNASGLGVASTGVAIRLRRVHRTQAYVIALLTIPLLLIAVLAVASRRRRAGDANVVIGAAAVLLALLPIRAVLVPADVASLTLVDWALGAEVALLALLVVWRETAR